jgi:hypothetical protein
MVGQRGEVCAVKVNDTLTEGVSGYLVCPTDKAKPDDTRPIGYVGHGFILLN